MPSIRCVSVAALLLCCVPLCAQYKVKRLVFKGADRYTQQQLEAVAALKPGQAISTKEMGEASQRLMDTGAFADIETTLDGPMAGINVIFKLKMAPSGGFLPVSYDNFPWFTPEDRERELRTRVPLYLGTIPAGSNLQAAVQTALTTMLEEKGVTATVETVEEPSTELRPTPIIVYRVTSPKVELHDVHLVGVREEIAPQERAALGRMVRQPFHDGREKSIQDAILTPYLDAGYIDAHLDDLQRTTLPTGAGVVPVDVSATLVGGDSYRISSVTWPGSDLFSTADFEKTNKLHAGDIASDAKLRASYRPILLAYLQRGYVDASIDTQPVRDTAAHTVAYTLKVTPGEVYKVGTLTIAGLSPAQRAAFDALWTLPVGSTYDGVYTFSFLPKHQQAEFQRGLNSSVTTIADPDTKLVEIQMLFAPAQRP